MTTSDMIEELVDAGFGAWSGYGLDSNPGYDDARTLRVTLPDGKVADRHTDKKYAYVVAVNTPDGWRPFRWVIRDRDLLRAITDARHIYCAETQTLNVEAA
jgi:hypothetical protein